MDPKADASAQRTNSWRTLRGLLLRLLIGVGWPGLVSAQDLDLELLGTWSFPTPTNAFALAMRGDYAYVGMASGDLHIVNVSNPALPVAAGHLSVTGVISECTLDGPIGYVSTFAGGVHVVDLGNPSTPRILDSDTSIQFPGGSSVHGRYLFVSGTTPSLAVFDISDPTDLRLVGRWDSPLVGADVLLNGQYAYLSGQGLAVLDISNPARPREIGQVPTQTSILPALGRLGDRMYAITWPEGLREFDLGNPAAPAWVRTLRFSGGVISSMAATHDGLALSGDLPPVTIIRPSGRTPWEVAARWSPKLSRTAATAIAAVGDRIAVIAEGRLDLARWRPSSMPRVASPAMLRLPASGGSALVLGNKVHVGGFGLVTYHWENPLQPEPLWTNISTYPVTRVVQAGSFMAANAGGRLQVYGLSDPGKPQLLSSALHVGTSADPLVGSGSRVFWGATNGILAADLADPANPQVHEAAVLGAPVLALCSEGDLLVAATGLPELVAFRTGADGPLVELGRQPLETTAQVLASADGRLYSLSRTTGMLDIRAMSGTPPWPLLGRHKGGPIGYSLIVKFPHVYVGCGAYGIAVFDTGDPSRIRRVAGNAAILTDALATDGRALLALGDFSQAVLPLVTDEPSYTLLSPTSVQGQFQFRVRGIPGSAAALERAQAGGVWQPWQEVRFGEDALVLQDPIPAAGGSQLYRMSVP